MVQSRSHDNSSYRGSTDNLGGQQDGNQYAYGYSQQEPNAESYGVELGVATQPIRREELEEFYQNGLPIANTSARGRKASYLSSTSLSSHNAAGPAEGPNNLYSAHSFGSINQTSYDTDQHRQVPHTTSGQYGGSPPIGYAGPPAQQTIYAHHRAFSVDAPVMVASPPTMPHDATANVYSLQNSASVPHLALQHQEEHQNNYHIRSVSANDQSSHFVASDPSALVPDSVVKEDRSNSLASVDRVNHIVASEGLSIANCSFGSPSEPGGMFTITSVESQVYVSYLWTIPAIQSVVEDKLVSPAFGPRDWSWQAVLYPNGVAANIGTLSGAFIRPIRNDLELLANEDWQRPIESFTFRVKRQREVDQDDNSASEFLFSQTSEYSFTGFSAEQSGWGFQDFYPLPLPDDAIDPQDGSLHVVIDVSGTQTVPTSTVAYEYRLNELHVSHMDSAPAFSLPFGPRDCSWVVEFHRLVGEANQMAVYIRPVLSEFEKSLGSLWSRQISTLVVQFLDPQSKQVLGSKSLTGGFIFSAKDNERAGWDQFWSPQDFTNNGSPESVLLHVTVTWDSLELAKSTRVGKIKTALSLKNDSAHRINDNSALQGQLDQLQAVLQSKIVEVEQASYRTQAFKERLAIVEANLEETQQSLTETVKYNDEVDLLRERVAIMTEELQFARKEQEMKDELHITLKDVKARLLKTRLSLENSSETQYDFEEENVKPEDLKAELLVRKQQIAQLEFELAKSNAALSQNHRQTVDESLSVAIEHSEPPGSPTPDEKIANALETAANETYVANTALSEVHSKLSVMDADVPRSERASMVAELAIIQCGLDVAYASLFEAQEISAAKGLTLPEQSERIFGELLTVRSQIHYTRQNIESDNAFTLLVTGAVPLDATVPLEASQYGYFQDGNTQQQQYDESIQDQLPNSPNQYAQNQLELENIQTVPLCGEGDDSLAKLLPPPTTGYASEAMIKRPTNEAGLPSGQYFSDFSTTNETPSKGLNHEKKSEDLPVEQIMSLLKTAIRTSKSPMPFNESVGLGYTKEWDPEVWTPEPSKNASHGLDSKQLTELLNAMRDKDNSFGIVSFIIAILTVGFSWYIMVYIVCDRPVSDIPSIFHPYHHLCESTILPAWETTKSRWHGAAEDFVFNYVPSAVDATKKAAQIAKKGASHAKNAIEDTMRRAVERAPDPPFKPEVAGEVSSHPIGHNEPRTALERESSSPSELSVTFEANSTPSVSSSVSVLRGGEAEYPPYHSVTPHPKIPYSNVEMPSEVTSVVYSDQQDFASAYLHIEESDSTSSAMIIAPVDEEGSLDPAAEDETADITTTSSQPTNHTVETSTSVPSVESINTTTAAKNDTSHTNSSVTTETQSSGWWSWKKNADKEADNLINASPNATNQTNTTGLSLSVSTSIQSGSLAESTPESLLNGTESLKNTSELQENSTIETIVEEEKLVEEILSTISNISGDGVDTVNQSNSSTAIGEQQGQQSSLSSSSSETPLRPVESTKTLISSSEVISKSVESEPPILSAETVEAQEEEELAAAEKGTYTNSEPAASVSSKSYTAPLKEIEDETQRQKGSSVSTKSAKSTRSVKSLGTAVEKGRDGDDAVEELEISHVVEPKVVAPFYPGDDDGEDEDVISEVGSPKGKKSLLPTNIATVADAQGTVFSAPPIPSRFQQIYSKNMEKGKASKEEDVDDEPSTSSIEV